MKLDLKRTSLLLIGILVGSKLFAQTIDTSHVSTDYVQPFSSNNAFRTWSIGVSAGVLTPNTPFGSNNQLDFTSPNGKLGYGAYIKNQITPTFGIQADFLGGKLSGDNAQPNASGLSPYNGFDTKIQYSASLSANITLGNITWHTNKSAIQPYITLGAGTMHYVPVLTYSNGTVANAKTDNSDGSINELFIPAGLGVKFNISPGVNLDLGYQVNFVYSDNIDGYVHGSTNDKFAYAHAGLEFAIGKRSKSQLAVHNPVSSMRTEYLWENQDTRTRLQAQIDAEKAKNEQLRNDLNTTNANLAKLTMDSDGDGVPDFFDKCPNTPAGTKVDGSGCPLPVTKPAENVKVYVTEEDRKVVKEAIRNLEFDFGKATLRPRSFPSLDRVAQLLIDKNFSLKLAGHTDNVGSANANMKLSKDPAESIKTYLVSKGASASRIEATGYGKTQPIASNKTAKGRQINRRVEFTLF
ncbi:MAG: OmpA family protein [Bacteroidota bacterium]|nr:OmpA family protein [Bacteroidota bacterium]